MTTRMTPDERYSRDTMFHSMVDMMTQAIVNCDYTPTELREAAVLAAIRYETYHARPKYLMNADQLLRRVDSYHGREDREHDSGDHNLRDDVRAPAEKIHFRTRATPDRLVPPPGYYDMTEADVLAVLERHGAILRDTHVVLASGRHADAYVNKDQLYTAPHAMARLCRELAARLADHPIGVVVGPALGGIALAQWVAYGLGVHRGRAVDAAFAEKDEAGAFALRRGYDRLVAAANVLVVEDVLTTGGSLRSVVDAVRAAGGTVDVAAALVNRGGVRAEDLGVPALECLAAPDLASYDAAACPLCAAGVPVNPDVGHGRAFLDRSPGAAV